MRDGSFWKGQLRQVIAGRRWLLALDVMAAAVPRVAMLKELGAERPFVIAGHAGMGQGPAPEDAESVLLGTRGDTMMASIRAAEAAFARPGSDVCARIDAWDPKGEARVIGTIFAAGESVCGRPYWGGRPASWRALEDKILAEDVWDRAGVLRAPAEVVTADEGALAAAASKLDRGMGTVWSGDMREGFNGGAEYVRWVRSAEASTPAAAFFEAHCDRVRVMPFLDGVPCSIHGMVFPDSVIALRPCEMVVLRSSGSPRFRYASAATFWEPAPQDAEAMRDVARRVGAHLRERVGYRGAFTVDGVMTVDGFRPTELNPRMGAALRGLASGIPDLPLELLNLALVQGEALDYRPMELEALILEGSRANRRGSSSVVVKRAITEEREADLRFLGGRCERAEGPPVDIRVRCGPNPVGGIVSVRLSAELTPSGPPVAPRVVAALDWASREWDLDLGPLEAAPDLRAGAGADASP